MVARLLGPAAIVTAKTTTLTSRDGTHTYTFDSSLCTPKRRRQSDSSTFRAPRFLMRCLRLTRSRGTLDLRLEVERFSLSSSKPFDQVVTALHSAIGHPHMKEFWESAHDARSLAELETVFVENIQTPKKPPTYLGPSTSDLSPVSNPQSSQSSPKSSAGCGVRIVPFPQRRSSAGQNLSHPQQIRSGCFGLTGRLGFDTAIPVTCTSLPCPERTIL